MMTMMTTKESLQLVFEEWGGVSRGTGTWLATFAVFKGSSTGKLGFRSSCLDT